MSTASDASEIRRVLQVYDQSGSGVPARQAVGMLEGITGKIAKAPAAYDLLTDPADAEAWRSAGGESYCDNQEFTNLLAARWMEVLSKPDFANAGYDKEELDDLKCDLEDWMDALTAVDLEFGDREALVAKLDALIAAAPEPDEDDSDSD